MVQPLKVVLLAPDPEAPRALAQWLGGDDLTLVGVAASSRELLDQAGQWQPQVVLAVPEAGAVGGGQAGGPLGLTAGQQGRGDGILDILAELAVAKPQIGRVVALGSRDFAACRAALRAGADEVLLLPEEGEALAQVLRQAAEAGGRRAQAAAALTGAGAGLPGMVDAGGLTGEGGEGRGYLVAFWSGRGGAGKTTLAAGTALALTYRGAGRVLLVDLDLAVGGAEVALDLRPERTLLDLLPVVQELDRSHLERVAVRHGSGLLALCGGAGPAAAGAFGAEEVRLLLEACRRHFDVVVLDVPTALTPVSRTALQEAAAVLYVVTPDLPAVRALGRVLEAEIAGEVAAGAHRDAGPVASRGAAPGAGRDGSSDVNSGASLDAGPLLERHKLALVINRTSRVADVTRKEIESLAQLPVVGEVRSDFRTLQAHLGQGWPLVQPEGKRTSALGREISRLAAHVGG